METSGYWTRFSKRRLSRRRALATGVAGLGAAALGLAACGGDDDEGAMPGGQTPAADETPRPGGSVKSGKSSDPGQLDAEQTVAGYWAAASFNGYLHAVNGDDPEIDLHVAESLEQPDELTYIWKLRQNVKFHNTPPVNGRAVTAADVTYSFTRRAEDTQSQLDKLFLKTYVNDFGDTDTYTFRLTTKEPYAPTLDETAMAGYPIQPREAVEAGEMGTRPIGCGPWMIEEFVRGERVLMKKNPDYYKPGRPYLDSYEHVIIPDNPTLVQGFRTGQFDSTNAVILKPQRDEISKDKNINWYPFRNLYPKIIIAKVDQPPFNDARVLEALDLVIDREDVLQKAAFGDGKYGGPVPPDLTYWALPQEELRDFYRLDTAKARQLLTAAGYADGLEAELVVPNLSDTSKFAEVIAAQTEKAGIKLNLAIKELGVWLAQHLYAKNFTLTFAQNLPFTDPDRYVGAWSTAGAGGFNFSGYSNPEMDEWVAKTRREVNPEARKQLVLDAQRAMIRQHGPLLLLPLYNILMPLWNRVHGASYRIAGVTGAANYYEDIWVSD